MVWATTHGIRHIPEVPLVALLGLVHLGSRSPSSFSVSLS